ncbi:phospholipid phosphatase [Paramagnetospirillum kuznetsovii]|uniref:Phospholipid phosphatase n=1 Tax=Paramagnetospirillum kuznetsovii TaxID=2053833 RepID=A0A364P0U8_9PROT|nr:phosphatase PAP2 family protein [Paramagnetospirillum kuznetsovii]RAU22926.1 phospholipid phosphatase [Paramagnetospirillum kuznetsovii]
MTILDRLVLAWERSVGALAERWRDAAGFRQAVADQWERTERRPLTWMTVYAAGPIVIGYVVLDRPLALWLKAKVGGEFEGFLKTVTHLGLGGVWLIPSGVLLVMIFLAWRAAPTLEIRAKLERAAWVPGFLFLSVAGSGLLNSLIKILVGRTRPKLLFEQGLYDFAPLTHAYATNSFPSGHSQAAFAAMTALMLIFPRYDIAFVAMAVLVAASRVLTTVHFFSDAVMGAWLGVVVTILIHRLLTMRGIEVRLRFERDRRLGQ